ncbi:MAG: flagellar basal body-associated FliL family protein [Paracoccaceae bacterium]
MAKILPILLIVIGLAGGIGAGLFLRPAAESGMEAACEDAHGCEPAADDHAEPASSGGGHGAEENGDASYVKLSKQFVVPVLKAGKVSALVVMSLSLEIEPSLRDTVFTKEPKLRDALLQVMFLHANSGGFEGQFTGGEKMSDLRGSLKEAARKILGDSVFDVLVTDILRQDV